MGPNVIHGTDWFASHPAINWLWMWTETHKKKMHKRAGMRSEGSEKEKRERTVLACVFKCVALALWGASFVSKELAFVCRVLSAPSFEHSHEFHVTSVRERGMRRLHLSMINSILTSERRIAVELLDAIRRARERHGAERATWCRCGRFIQIQFTGTPLVLLLCCDAIISHRKSEMHTKLAFRDALMCAVIRKQTETEGRKGGDRRIFHFFSWHESGRRLGRRKKAE